MERAFARTADGLVHYRSLGRRDGAGIPLILLHAAPGSSRGLEPVLGALHEQQPGRLFLAPDMPGHGESEPLALDAPTIADYAASLLRLLDALGITMCDLYGTHTGARIACETAILGASRVRKVIFDGIGDYDPPMRERLLAHYAPEMQPDEYGRQFVWAFNFVRDMSLHFPYFDRDPAHRLMTRPVPSPAELHRSAVDVLQGLGHYHKSYRAAFAYETRKRVGLVSQPTLLLRAMTELPNLQAATDDLAARMQHGDVVSIGSQLADKACAILRYAG